MHPHPLIWEIHSLVISIAMCLYMAGKNELSFRLVLFHAVPIPFSVCLSLSLSHVRESELLQQYFEQLVSLEHHMQVGNKHQHTLYALIDLLDYS